MTPGSGNQGDWAKQPQQPPGELRGCQGLPGANVYKLEFYSPLTLKHNKLECLSPQSLVQTTVM